MDANGLPQRCLLTMTSTQLKKARKWVTQMQSRTAMLEAPLALTVVLYIRRDRGQRQEQPHQRVQQNGKLHLSHPEKC
jgi:hypothetical protein